MLLKTVDINYRSPDKMRVRASREHPEQVGRLVTVTGIADVSTHPPRLVVTTTGLLGEENILIPESCLEPVKWEDTIPISAGIINEKAALVCPALVGRKAVVHDFDYQIDVYGVHVSEEPGDFPRRVRLELDWLDPVDGAPVDQTLDWSTA